MNIDNTLKYLKSINWLDGFYTPDDLISLAEVGNVFVVEAMTSDVRKLKEMIDDFLSATGLPMSEYERLINFGVTMNVDRKLADKDDSEREEFWRLIGDAQLFLDSFTD